MAAPELQSRKQEREGQGQGRHDNVITNIMYDL